MADMFLGSVLVAVTAPESKFLISVYCTPRCSKYQLSLPSHFLGKKNLCEILDVIHSSVLYIVIQILWRNSKCQHRKVGLPSV
jgi:hypothetical protein